MNSTLKVKRIHPNAKLPTKANPGDLGLDLYAAGDTILTPRSVTLVDTGIACEFPDGWGYKIFDRSSVSTKRKLFVVAGVLDSGYRGVIKVAIFNSTDEWDQFEEGDKIAQMVPMPVIEWPVVEVDSINDTDRGEGGFGSSGAR